MTLTLIVVILLLLGIAVWWHFWPDDLSMVRKRDKALEVMRSWHPENKEDPDA